MSGRHEIPDDTPVALPIGFRPPPSMVELIRMHIRRELSQEAADNGNETFAEADDFDIDDDPVDPSSPWELNFDQATAPFEAGSDPAPAPAAASPAASDAPPAQPSPEASSPPPP